MLRWSSNSARHVAKPTEYSNIWYNVIPYTLSYSYIVFPSQSSLGFSLVQLFETDSTLLFSTIFSFPHLFHVRETLIEGSDRSTGSNNPP
jgi:hypothetical protein